MNNAGWTYRNKPILEVTEEEFDRVYAINVKSIFLMIKVAAPVMIAQGGGCMINIGSTAGIRPRPGLTWYNASKGAVNLGSKSLAVELAPAKIRVNCVAPVMGETAAQILHGHAGHTREPSKVHCDHTARAFCTAVRCREHLRLPRLRRGRIPDRRCAPGRRRPGLARLD